MNNVDRLGSSFRDPSGFLFRKDGILYRQINNIYSGDYEKLTQSGLYDNLVSKKLLVEHEDVSGEFRLEPPAYKVIRPKLIQHVSYPYEWCFSQLRDAALLTLRIQKIALDYDLSLKDCSAYNIQFSVGKPILMDTLSFEQYREGEPWVAYRQFCQHFLAPLALMAYKDVRLSKLLRTFIDGVPLDLTSKLLPARTRFNFPVLTHIHLHASAQQRYADKPVKPGDVRIGKVSRTAFLGLISSLRSIIKKLEWKPAGTEWGDYYEICAYSESALDEKKRVISEWVEELQPANVWDLGANLGFFSRISSEQGIPTLAFDIDSAAVEQNYLEVKKQHEGNLLPLVMDLTNPSPSLGWANQERDSFLDRGPAELILALALIHHLVISNNVPLIEFASLLAKTGDRAIVEFVPKEDQQVQKLLLTRQDIFEHYDLQHFEQAMENFFEIKEVASIEGTPRLLYLIHKK
jgi:hypothetical protein